MILDYEKLKKTVTPKKIKGLEGPIILAIGFCKSKSSLHKIIEKKLQNKYSQYIADVWIPDPKDAKEKSKKNRGKKILLEILEVIDKDHRLILDQPSKNKKLCYKDMTQSFHELEQKFTNRKKSLKLLKGANPFLTAGIAKSYAEGIRFQKIAKLSSSVEGKWGDWIENTILQFNPSIIKVGAGGIDCILDNTCYDIKAGPNVLNKGQVLHNQTKRKFIQKLGNDRDFKSLVNVKDYKVAISYGREETAGTYMKNQNGLIIFGSDTWRILTGNEENAYKLFLWQIRYKIEAKGSKWDRNQLESAVKDFIEMNYGNNPKKLKCALQYSEFQKLKKRLK